MNSPKTISPTSHFCLDIPGDVRQQVDCGVASFWHNPEEVVLQMSSYCRKTGQQVCANTRLQDRLIKEDLVDVCPVNVTPERCCDAAAATGVDHDGVKWLFGYAVWPDLAIFYSILGKKVTFTTKSRWACDAIRTIRRD
jgi:hypothetical protein